MNILLSLLALAVCSLAGFAKSSVLSGRVRQLEEIQLMIEKMQTYLKYEKMPTGEMVEQLSVNHSLEGLCFLEHCREGMRDNPNFPVVWKSSVEQSAPQLSLVQEDYEILDLIGGVLGGSDLQSQLGGLTLASGLVKQNLSDASGQKETKGKLYRSLGVLSGIGIAVLVL